MPNLLSRSKHEEFESNSTLQIRIRRKEGEEEKKEEKQRISHHCEIAFLCTVHVYVDFLLLLVIFLAFFLICSIVIVFSFGFFGFLYEGLAIKAPRQSL